MRGFATCTAHGATESSGEDSVPSRPIYSTYDDEPDWEAIVEARAEARAEREIERAEAAYERMIYGD